MEAVLQAPLATVKKAASAVSDSLTVSASALDRIVTQACEIVASPNPTRAALVPLGEAMDDLTEEEETTSHVHILHYHIGALAAAASAFAWVADPSPLVAVRSAQAAAKKPISALRKKDVPHSDFADAIDTFLDAIEDFVKGNHQVPLVFVDAGPTVVSPTTATHSSTVPTRYDDSHSALHLVAFRETIARSALKEFLKAAAKIGGLVKVQADSVDAAFFETYKFLVDASGKKKPVSADALQKDLTPIGMQMGVVAEFPAKCPPRDMLVNHLTAVAEAINMLSWVSADSRPTSFVSDAEGAASFYLNKVLTTTKSEGNATDHRAFVEALRNLLTETKTYIKEHHTMGVSYNKGVIAKPGSQIRSIAAASAKSPEPEQDTYVSKFNELIDGSVAAYVTASKKIGSEVAQQASAILAAFKAEADFLDKAISMPKPDDIKDLLAPIATEMGNVAAVTEKVGPRGQLTNHCTAVSEAVSALGWVAVDEKAAVFVGDMAGAGQFFLDKVKMAAKSTSDPAAHREWAKTVETLFQDLKAYVKEYHTQKLVWNPPKRAKARSALPQSVNGTDESSCGDYVTKFEEFVNETVVPYVDASKKVGGPVAEQAESFLAAFRAEASFLKKAISTPKPADIQTLLAPIAAEMGNVGSVSEKIDPRGPFANHCTAISESVGALGWVAVDEKATGYVGDMSGAGQFFLDKVKMGAKNTDNPTVHREWAKSVEAVFAGLKAYVKEHHTQKLVWNPPKRAVRSAPAASASEGNSKGDYVTQFNDLVTGPLAAYVTASKNLGGDVAEQAKLFEAAWQAEAEFLAKAINMTKPADLESMLKPIATHMSAVSAITEKMDPRGPLGNHCTAVSESVAALGWVAVEEKAAVYVGDMAGAGQFFLDKVKMAARNTDNPAAHREWANSLEIVFKELRAYVKDHHTQKLTWKR